MKSIIVYFCLVILGVVSYMVIDKAFDLRSDYYRSKYEKEITENEQKFKIAEASAAQLRSKVDELTSSISVLEGQNAAANEALRQKQERVRTTKQETQDIKVKFDQIKVETQSMTDKQKCLDVQKRRLELNYELGDYKTCEK